MLGNMKFQVNKRLFGRQAIELKVRALENKMKVNKASLHEAKA